MVKCRVRRGRIDLGPNPSFFGVPYLIDILYVIVPPMAAWRLLSPIWAKRRLDADTDYMMFHAGSAAAGIAFFIVSGLAAAAPSL